MGFSIKQILVIAAVSAVVGLFVVPAIAKAMAR